MDWKDLGKKIAKVGAPLLGTAVGGPAGGAIGTLVASLFGADPDDPAAIAEAIKGDPEAAIKLREIELNHKARLEEIALEIEMLDYRDRDSARQREVETTRATGKRDYSLYGIAWLTIVGFFAILIVVMTCNVEMGLRDVVMVLIGSLVAQVGKIYDYLFGSSRGSKEKDQVLAQNIRLNK